MDKNIKTDKDLTLEIKRLEQEFWILHEISNAMRTTLKLDQIFYIILTALTAHEGLGFNRAMLFLVKEDGCLLEGVMGIGPHSGEEADKIWKAISQERMTSLEDFIAAYDNFKKNPDSGLNSVVKNIKIPIREDMGVLAKTILEGMPFEITTEEARKMVIEEFAAMLETEYFVTVPLRAKDKILGAILVDNIFNKKPITKSEMRILTMFANHAGLAIENSRLFEETVRLSNTDGLTQLLNYGRLQQLLSSEIEKAKINESPLSLVMLDIDNFKNYNDTLGHIKGDDALRQVAVVLRNNSRKCDIVARYGGEEFSVAMPSTTKECAQVFAERLRAEVEKVFSSDQNIPHDKRLTISLGVATLPDDAATKNDLFNRADAALYDAKQSGKNKVCLYFPAKGNDRTEST
ncbi:MAG: diguanylate cyclase [Candidatus Omnitrophota bacterium]